MYVGFSLALCIHDIRNGIISIEEVDHILVDQPCETTIEQAKLIDKLMDLPSWQEKFQENLEIAFQLANGGKLRHVEAIEFPAFGAIWTFNGKPLKADDMLELYAQARRG